MGDDGKVYLYSGQGLPIPEINGRRVRGSMVCELEEDMLTVKGEQKTVTSAEENPFTENLFFEASSIRKIDGKYYFIYSPLPNTHFLCYAVSDYPDRGFVYGGVLVSNADIFPEDPKRQKPMNYWGNNHGSLLQVEDKFYVFHHRNSNKTPYARQGCAEQIFKDENGRFRQAELTSAGLYSKAYPMKGEYPAYIAWQLQKKDMNPFVPFKFLEYSDEDPYIKEEENEEVPYIANLRDGAKAGYRYLLFDGTETQFFVKIRGNGDGELIVDANEKETWTEIKVPCHCEEKKAAICLTYHGNGAIDMLSIGME